MAQEIYRGESILLRWGDTSSAGRTVTLQLDEEGPQNPFKGLKTGPNGERFAIVVVALGNDQKAADVLRKAEKPKERRPWHTLRPSARAAMLCDDPGFWDFIGSYGPITITSKATADTHLKELCEAVSKRDFDAEGSPCAKAFEALEGTFRAWQQARGHGVAA